MIYIASDHAGYELKNAITEHLKQSNIEFEDIGPHKYDKNDDYPDFIIPAAEKVSKDPDKHCGIILGGSGQGEAMAANKVKGIRAAVYYSGNEEIITLSKLHNNANVLSLGARFINKDEAIKIVKLWLDTKFTNKERHLRRIKKISEFENNLWYNIDVD